MGEVLKFPGTNVRADMTAIPTSVEEVIKNVNKMKNAYFSTIAENIVDDVIRSLSVLKLEEGSVYKPLESKDIIILKESIISAMCRVTGLEHPLHEIADQELILSETIRDIEGFDVPYFSYRFKSEPDDAIRTEV